MVYSFQSKIEAEGLLFLGESSLDLDEDYARFNAWISESKHAGMQFLEKYPGIRQDPKKLLPEAVSATVVGFAYDQGDTWPMEETSLPRVAQYARFKDYHKIFRQKVERVCENFEKESPDFKYRVCVDTAPLLERALAAKTGNGFVGKNTCYIDEAKGSLLLLAIVLTNKTNEKAEIKKVEGCSTCTLCQVACPTGALDKDYTLDARKCLSYWTIEHRGEIPMEFWPHLSKYYFGCDICQLVCPYNAEARESQLSEKVEVRKYPDLVTTALMNESEYEKYFGGTPLTRAKRNGLRRNAIIALTVTKDPKLEEVFQSLSSEMDPVIVNTLNTARAFL